MIQFILGWCLLAYAFSAPYEVNKDHSHISFTISYMSLSEARGVFSDYFAELDFDPKHSNLKKVSATIKASSVDTGDSRRDAHLKKSDFFDVEKFPNISFHSTQIKTINPHLFEVKGDLEIRGVKKTVNLKTIFKGIRKDHVGKESAFFTASLKINRKDFGLVWNKLMDRSEYLLGDEVQINLVIQAQPIGRKTAFSAHMIPATQELENRAKRRIESGDKSLAQVDLIVSKSINKKKPVIESFHVMDLIVGFLGFCLLLALSFFIKMKLIKVFGTENHIENSFPSLVADLVIIMMTFLYTIWFFHYLYGQ